MSETILRAHRFRLDPTAEQEAYFRRACGVRRMAYNWALERWNQQYAEHRTDPKKFERPNARRLRKEFNRIKRDKWPWIAEVSSRIPETAIKDLGKAWNNFFEALKRGDKTFRKPRYAVRGRHDRFYVHQAEIDPRGSGNYIVERRVRVGAFTKIGSVRCRESQRFDGHVQGGAVVRDGRHWYLAVQVRLPHVAESHPTGGQVGIDMGVANVAALSSGELIEGPVARLEAIERQLRMAKRVASRRWSGRIRRGQAASALRDEAGQQLPASQRYRKQQDRVRVLEKRKRDVRREFLHRLSTDIVRRFELVAVEDLQLRNMTRSAKGTASAPGKNVAAKAELNRRLLSASLGELRRQLEYKTAACGGSVVAVPAMYTSQRCSECGHTAKGNRKTQACFCCEKCGHEDHADLNAAKNILAAALNGQE